MAISPPADIVLGVARSVDTSTYQAAVDRLSRKAAVTGAESASFASGQHSGPTRLQSATSAFETVVAGATTPRAVAGDTQTQASGPAADNKLDSARKFEAFILQSFLQEMLPKNAESVFGSGFAGETWKSFLAEHVAAEIARSGGIGIAERIVPSGTRASIVSANAIVPGSTSTATSHAGAGSSDKPSKSGEATSLATGLDGPANATVVLRNRS